MTDEQTPAAGPLNAESVALLKKGDLLMHEKYGLVTVREAYPPDTIAYRRKDNPHHGGGDDRGRFTFLGRPDQDGWIAWHGGENPLPGVKVDWRTKGGQEVLNCDSREACWGGSPGSPHRQVSRFRPHVASPSSTVVQGDAGGVDNRQIVAHIIEAAIVRHGCDPADLEDTLLDADQILTSITPAEPAEARVRELTERVEYLRRSRDGHATQANAEFEKRVRATEALEQIADMRPATCETGLAHDMAQIASEALAALQQAGEVG